MAGLAPLLATLLSSSPITVALLPPTESPLATRVEQALRAALRDTGAVKLQEPADTGLGVDQAAEAGWTCADRASTCLAQLGRALGVQVVVHMGVESEGPGAVVALRSVDVERTSDRWAETVRLGADEASWPASLRRAADALLGRGGRVVVAGAHASDRLLVDSSEVINAGSGETIIAGVQPGAHTLVVRSADGRVRQRQLVVDARTPLTVRVAGSQLLLPGESPEPRRAPLMPLAVAGAGAAIVGLGVIPAALGAISGVVGIALVSALPRLPDGRVILREGQSAAQLQLQLNGGIALAVAGVAAVALAAAVVVGGALTGIAGGAWWAFARVQADR